MKGSIIEGSSQEGVSNVLSKEVYQHIDRKVDKNEMLDMFKSKTNKIDTQIIIN